MATFKVGDRIRAIDNYYEVTSMKNEWEGVVEKPLEELSPRLIYVKTIKSKEIYHKGIRFTVIEEHFQLVKSHQFKTLWERLQ